MAAGDSYGASFSAAQSSAASLSGATDISGGGNYGGTSYGPGAYINNDQSGSLGASAGGFNLAAVAGVLLIIGALLYFAFRRKG